VRNVAKKGLFLLTKKLLLMRDLAMSIASMLLELVMLRELAQRNFSDFGSGVLCG